MSKRKKHNRSKQRRKDGVNDLTTLLIDDYGLSRSRAVAIARWYGPSERRCREAAAAFHLIVVSLGRTSGNDHGKGMRERSHA